MNLKTLWKQATPQLRLNNRLSFLPLIHSWEQRAKNEAPLYALQLKKILKQVKEFPLLMQPAIDIDELKSQPEALSFIVHTLFPVSIHPEERFHVMTTPFDLETIHASPAFHTFLDHEGIPTSEVEAKQSEMYHAKKFHAYRLILRKFYKKNVESTGSLVYKSTDENGTLRYFYSDINTDFVDVDSHMELPDLPAVDMVFSNTSPAVHDLGKLDKLLPLENFTFSGFCIVQFQDFTSTEAIAALNNALLEENDFSSPEFLQKVEQCVKSLLRKGNLKVGITAFQKFQDKYLFSERRLSNSVLIRHLCHKDCQNGHESMIAFLSQMDKPIFLNDLDFCSKSEKLLEGARGFGIKELIIIPLKYGDTIVGVLEICSEKEGELSPQMLHYLEDINHPLAIALQKNMKQFEYQVQSIIKKNYTAIQPAIEWKFNEIAIDNILDKENGLKSPLKPLVFEEVYPLYAAVDIRNSTASRVDAIQKDLQEQLSLAKSILHEALKLQPLPVLEKMMFKIDKLKKDIQLILVSEDEAKINHFILYELEPLFKHLSEVQPVLKPQIDQYFGRLDPTLGILYDTRRKFEESLSMINETIGQHIEKSQLEAQQMFPHYFEKYKTDGVEYNIYIGQSLVKDKVFDPIYLNNLKLWQLTVLCESAYLSKSLEEKLPIKLETTQMVLVHSSPLSISFRKDERKFDVEGAYNIRYEIMKKRIDKALIRESKERLTQPGTIAIIYSQAKEAEEYHDYINYLQAKGYLQPEIENIDLEDLQGVHGLKALRVKIAAPQFSKYKADSETTKTDTQK